MRSHPTDGVTALFIDDNPGGGCKCVCSNCDLEFIMYGQTNDHPYYCSQCKEEICYRPWYEW